MKKYGIIFTIIFVIFIIVFLLVVHLFYTNFNASNYNTYYPNTSNLSSDQKLKAINITVDDYFVNNYIQNYYNISSKKINYSIGDVKISKYKVIDLNENAELPMVEIIMGNSSSPGVNLYSFINLSQEKVVYIGFLNRSVNGSLINSNYDNITIADTGFNYNINLTNGQKLKIFSITLNDSKVQYYLQGYDYEIIDIKNSIMESYRPYPQKIIFVYPAVQILLKERYGNLRYILHAIIDLKNNRVYNVWRESVPLQYSYNELLI